MKQTFDIPAEVIRTTETLEGAGYEAYLVGGCVRDILLGKNPTDWDITTNAVPEEIQSLFPDTFYENDYGTVGVVNEDVTDERVKVIEITPYREETTYSNARHPDQVSFSKDLKDDLKRRDFTVNAVAYSVSKGQLVDLYDGQKDMELQVLRAVGVPRERFAEDALRMLRAVRFAAQLHFSIENETKEAIKENAHLLEKISVERIRDEFEKLILSDQPQHGLELARELGILQYVIPELEEGVGVEQNKDHVYDVWTHLVKSLQNAANKGWSLEIRLSALFHDIGKPKTRRYDKESRDYTFYGHEVVGARMVREILTRLKFPKATIQTVTKLVRWHMFFSDVDQITLSAVRRMIQNVGPENIWNLMKVRKCDRIGMGRPKEEPYRLRKYESMVEEAMRDPVSVGQLAIDGAAVMNQTKETPGPRIGWILHALLEEVLDDPSKNTSELLIARAQELSALSDTELKNLGEAGKRKREEAEAAELKEIRRRHRVR